VAEDNVTRFMWRRVELAYHAKESILAYMAAGFIAMIPVAQGQLSQPVYLIYVSLCIFRCRCICLPARRWSPLCLFLPSSSSSLSLLLIRHCSHLLDREERHDAFYHRVRHVSPTFVSAVCLSIYLSTYQSLRVHPSSLY